MKIRLLGVLGLAVLLCVPLAALAQDEGRGRGGRRGPGGPGGLGGFGRGMMQMEGDATQLLGLLRDEKVREEIEMSDDVYSSIQEAQRTIMADMRGLREMSEEQRQEAFNKMGEASQELYDEVVTPEQQKRLMGLLVQQAGMQAVMNALIAKEIGMSEADREKVQQAMQEIGEKLRAKMGELRDSGDFASMREQMSSFREEMEKAVAESVSDEHKKALEELKGEEFEFSQPQFGGGRGGPGRRGGERGGPGGRGGRGGGQGR